jgi:hypothetical protein
MIGEWELSWREAPFHLRCHSPRRRGIQYAAAFPYPTSASGILDRPPQCATAHKAGDDTGAAASACLNPVAAKHRQFAR